MIRSMTGFGAGRARVDDEEVAIELRAVNHKFCEVKARLPRELASLEIPLVKAIKSRISRGAVDFLMRRGTPNQVEMAPTVNVPLALAWREALVSLAGELGTSPDISWRDLAERPGVVSLNEKGVNLEAAGQAAELALDAALKALVGMREREGASLRADLESRLELVTAEVDRASARVPQVVESYRARLSTRISELLGGSEVDPQRLAQEVALFAERTDVAEELTRLGSHLAQARALLASEEPSGRKLEFLAQEMHREVNTTGAKSQDSALATSVIALKSELERFREQVANVE